MKLKQQNSLIGAFLLMGMLFASITVFAADDTPTLVEVYWKSKQQFSIPNATAAIALDPEKVNAEFANGSITVYGIARGAESIVLVYVGETPISVRVNVVDPPAMRMAPQLRDRSEYADVILSGSMQTSSNAVGLRQYGFTDGVSWRQNLDNQRHFEFTTETTAGSLATARSFNFNHGNMSYFAPNFEVQAIDFPLNLFGREGSVIPGSLLGADFTSLRGVNLAFHRRRRNSNCKPEAIPRVANTLVERRIPPPPATDCNPSEQEVTTYHFYAGTTQPYYFLTLSGTSDVAGFSFNHRVNRRFSFFGNSAFLSVPLRLYTVNAPRLNSGVQTLGFAFKLNQHWNFAADGGVSTKGSMGRGEFRYVSRRLDVGVAGATSAALFPYNQLLNTTSGTRDIRASALFRSNERFSESFSYNRSTTKEIIGFVEPGTYQYAASGIDVRINTSNDLNFQYAWSQSRSASMVGNSDSNQYIASWTSLFPRRISSGFQFTIGSVQDPLQLHSGDQWSVRESVTMPIGIGTLSVSVGHNETDPSLIQRISGRIGLLPLALQQAFLNDPIGFLNSGNLPPDLRAILEAANPAGTYVNVNGQFHVTRTLSFAPTFALSTMTDGTTSTWSPSFGYGLHWTPTRSLQINSNLSTIWYSDNVGGRRATVFSVGLVKQMFVAPSALLPSRQTRVVTGRVFRDNNINGAFNSGEPGLAGVRVQLDGKETVTTDAEGRFRFTRVSADVHQVLLALTDLKGPIRMTTPHQIEADTVRKGSVEVNFGVVNFARVMGLVYNDTKFSGQRDLSAKGLQKIRMTLKGEGGEKTIISEGTGEYQTTDVAPGDYKLIVDDASLPANYWKPDGEISVHVDPVSTSIIDVPIRALRSIGGRVLLRIRKDQSQGMQNAPQAAPGDFDTIPLAGVTISAGDAKGQSAADGSFLLRNLPAGDLTVTIVPVKPLPPGLSLPSGRVRLPDDPTEVHDATIVISNPELIPYLVGKTVEQIRNMNPQQNSPDALRSTGGTH
jgi:SdrD B-like domain